MNTLILAAGRGNRLHPLTGKTPKPLLEINGKSLLERLVESTSIPQIFGKVFINISYLPQSFIKKSLFSPLTFIFEREVLGPAATAVSLINREMQDLLVIHGDLLLDSLGLKSFAAYSLNEEFSLLSVHERSKSRARSRILFDQQGIVFECTGNLELPHKENLSSLNLVDNSETKVYSDSGIYFLRYKDITTLKFDFRNTDIRQGVIEPLSQKKLMKIYKWERPRESIETLDDYQNAKTRW